MKKCVVRKKFVSFYKSGTQIADIIKKQKT